MCPYVVFIYADQPNNKTKQIQVLLKHTIKYNELEISIR